MKKLAVLSLFDYTTETVKPWAEAGYICYCVDIQHPAGETRDGNIIRVGADIYTYEPPTDVEIVIVFGFPPCTDLAVSGAKHFANKLAANPEYRNEAMALVYRVRDIAEALGVPYYIENPVSVISSEWRKPNFTFHPWQYGGYIPACDAPHPLWPEHIAPRDAYPKRTCLWTGGGFEMPVQMPVEVEDGYSRQFKQLGGKSLKTKNIRSATPRGWAEAVFVKYAKRGGVNGTRFAHLHKVLNQLEREYSAAERQSTLSFLRGEARV